MGNGCWRVPAQKTRLRTVENLSDIDLTGIFQYVRKKETSTFMPVARLSHRKKYLGKQEVLRRLFLLSELLVPLIPITLVTEKFWAVSHQRGSALDFAENLESEVSGLVGQVLRAFRDKTPAVCALNPEKRNPGDTGNGKALRSFLPAPK